MRFLLPIYVLLTSSLNSPRPPVSVNMEKRKMLLFFKKFRPYVNTAGYYDYHCYYCPLVHGYKYTTMLLTTQGKMSITFDIKFTL